MTASAPFGNSGLAGWLAGIFTVLTLAALGYFEWKDGRPPTYDDAWYLETSLRMFNALAEGRLLEFIYQYCGAFGGSKAPLISVMALPFYALFGRQLDPTFCVNGVFLVVSSFCLYRLAAKWFSPIVGLIALVIYQTFPVVAGLSRAYMTDYALAALVLAFVYCLELSQNLRQPAVNLLLGVVLGLGLLMKVIFPAFVVLPLILFWLAERAQRGVVQPVPDNPILSFSTRYPLAAIGAIGCLIASSWYALNLKTVLSFAWGNAFGSIVTDYRAPGLWAWVRDFLASQGLSPYYAWGFVCLAPVAVAIAAFRGEARWSPRHLVMLGWAAPLIAMMASQNMAIRLAMPMLPVIAIALAASLVTIAREVSRRPWVHGTVIVAALAVPLAGYARLTLGAAPVQGRLYHGTYWYRIADQQGQWNQMRILDALSDHAREGNDDFQVAVGVEHSYLNHNLLSYLRFREQAPFGFVSLGYAETSVDRAAARLVRTPVRFLLMADGFEPGELPEFLNRVVDGIDERLDRGELPFELIQTIPLTDRVSVRLYRRH